MQEAEGQEAAAAVDNSTGGSAITFANHRCTPGVRSPSFDGQQLAEKLRMRPARQGTAAAEDLGISEHASRFWQNSINHLG